MTESTTRKPRETKPKIFGTFITKADGTEELIGYTEHYSKTQAQSKILDDRIETRLADHNDLIKIGRDGIKVDYLAAGFQDDSTLFNGPTGSGGGDSSDE